MTVSVIIPTFNRSSLLIKAIESVLKQTLPVLEILICDDGSTDNSKELVGSLNNPVVKWIDCGQNGRPAIPRNIGINHAIGEWIAFLDSDDEWLPDKLEKQKDLISRSNNKFICTNAWAYNNSDKWLFFEKTQNRELSFENLVKSNSVICSSVLCKKSLLLDAFLFPIENELKALEDYVLWLKISMFTQIEYAAMPLVLYRDLPKDSVRKESYDTIQQRGLIFAYFERNKKRISKPHLIAMYYEFKGQYKNRIKRLFDFEKLKLKLK